MLVKTVFNTCPRCLQVLLRSHAAVTQLCSKAQGVLPWHFPGTLQPAIFPYNAESQDILCSSHITWQGFGYCWHQLASLSAFQRLAYADMPELMGKSYAFQEHSLDLTDPLSD